MNNYVIEKHYYLDQNYRNFEYYREYMRQKYCSSMKWKPINLKRDTMKTYQNYIGIETVLGDHVWIGIDHLCKTTLWELKELIAIQWREQYGRQFHPHEMCLIYEQPFELDDDMFLSEIKWIIGDYAFGYQLLSYKREKEVFGINIKG